MAVDKPHPEYTRSSDRWERARDAFDGSDSIKAACEKYLPRPAKQKSEAYAFYKDRALWFGATARTVTGLIGAIFRKAPVVEFPERLAEHLEDVTLDGVPFATFAQKLTSEVLLTGRQGLLVEMSADGSGNRPYLVAYPPEAIVNWRESTVGGRRVLTMVALRESAEKLDPADPFAHAEETVYRVLSLDESMLYRVDLWVKVESSEKFALAESFEPRKSGQRLNFIPFQFFGPSHLTASIEKSPVLDVVDVNVSHYRSSADLESARYYTGQPQYWLAGFDVSKVLEVGSTRAWVTDKTDAKAGIIEYSGQGLAGLENALTSKEHMMAVLGARLLEQTKRASETAEAIRLRQSGDHSVMQTLAQTVSLGLTNALAWHAWWAGADESTVSVELNSDFVDVTMTSTELTALMGAWQSGFISYDTAFYNLRRGEMIPESRTAEEELELIRAGTPL